LDAAGIQHDGSPVTSYLHYGVKGDWVLQQVEDHADTYRVAEKFFNSTYDVPEQAQPASSPATTETADV
jgi:hypothetical protein